MNELKRKNHGLRRDFSATCQMIYRLSNTLSRFTQRAQAFGTQCFSNLFTVLEHRYFLQIGLKSTRSRFLRPRAVQTKRCVFSTSITFSHFQLPFSQDNMIANYLNTGRQSYHNV